MSKASFFFVIFTGRLMLGGDIMIVDIISGLFQAGFYLIGLALKICGYLILPVLAAVLLILMAR